MPTTTDRPSASAHDALIVGIGLRQCSLPLSEPYKLAFGDVRAFDTLIADVALEDGRRGLGEATILTGYTDETVDDAWPAAQSLANSLIGTSAANATATLAAHLKRFPFTVTMLTSAADMALDHPILRADAAADVPIVFGLNPTDDAGIASALDTAFAAGFGTVKVKVGLDWAADLARVKRIQAMNAGRMQLRIDGNQGFTQEDALAFASGLDPSDIELLEQPCGIDAWDAHAAVARVSTVPLMLDESIYGLDEIDRAADVGARFVKLKLMKAGSIDGLVEGLERITAHGMTAVLGNGVASDVGCWMEAMVARHAVTTAGEMNGFRRPSAHLVKGPLSVRNGAIHIPAGWTPALDEEETSARTMDYVQHGALFR